jgi:hypothetical protein
MDEKVFHNADDSVKVRSSWPRRVGPPYEMFKDEKWIPTDINEIQAILSQGGCIYWNPA